MISRKFILSFFFNYLCFTRISLFLYTTFYKIVKWCYEIHKQRDSLNEIKLIIWKSMFLLIYNLKNKRFKSHSSTHKYSWIMKLFRFSSYDSKLPRQTSLSMLFDCPFFTTISNDIKEPQILKKKKISNNIVNIRYALKR